MVTINGDSDRRFAPVEDAFRRNFEDLGEVGAALCIYRDGRPVVDLWGGYKDAARAESWERDTIVWVCLGCEHYELSYSISQPLEQAHDRVRLLRRRLRAGAKRKSSEKPHRGVTADETGARGP